MKVGTTRRSLAGALLMCGLSACSGGSTTPSGNASATRFYSSVGGHLDFLTAANLPVNTDAVLNLAFGIPVAAQNPAF
jgi:hypothetical protein